MSDAQLCSFVSPVMNVLMVLAARVQKDGKLQLVK